MGLPRRLTELLAPLLLCGCVAAHAAPPPIHLLTIDGVINPATSRYFRRELTEAAQSGAHAVILRLNTPGGLETSMREITQAMLESEIPVIVHVAPQGARAASAGMFITLAGHVAAMAPGTNIGAAHPVAIGERGRNDKEGGQAPVMAEKLEQDAAALARSIAQARGRNAAWAESAVLKSVSITATEALRKDVIDLIATDTPELLRMLDGRRVTTTRGPVSLATARAPIEEQPMTLPERILHVITDPNIAYLLMTIGFIGILAELYNPGLLFPGITGALSLILAFVAFGSLPVSWAGILLLVIGIGLLVLDLMTEGFGIIGVSGIIAFLIGSLLLYTPVSPVSPSMPDIQVSRWLILAMGAAAALFFFGVGRAVFKARKRPVTTGIEALTGQTGIAVTDLAPQGLVRIESETWNAETGEGPVKAGEKIRVIGVHGVTLKVEAEKHAA